MFKLALRWVLALFGATLSGVVLASSLPEVERGLAWLSAQVQTDGSLANEAQSVATPIQNRVEALQALRLLASPPESLVNAVASDSDESTENLARRIVVLHALGRDVSTEIVQLAARRNADNGFGDRDGYDSSVLDTAWSLIGIGAVAGSANTTIDPGVFYLLSTQASDGSFGLPGNPASPYLTALVSLALQTSPPATAVADAISRANTWLLVHQDVNGSWGSPWETSMVYLALVGRVSDPGLQSRTAAYLVSQQGDDGSWAGDPFITALALRALTAKPIQPATTGRVVGRVLHGDTGNAMAGAKIAVTNGPETATDAQGNFELTLAGGDYELTVSADGYNGRRYTFSLVVGTVVNLGDISLDVAANTGSLHGVVSDASGMPVKDALVSVSGSVVSTTTTAADGSFRLSGLSPGPATIAIEKNGYDTVSAVAEILSGVSLVFNPVLPAAGGSSDPNVASLFGRVTDTTSNAALAGVVVTLSGQAHSADVTTAPDGSFHFAGIPPGGYVLRFALANYATKEYSLLVAGGTGIDLGVIELSKLSTEVTLHGRVTDRADDSPIPGALVAVQGTQLSAQTDAAGAYVIQGLAVGSVSLRVSASGYTSQTYTSAFAAPGDYVLNPVLVQDQSGPLGFASLTTDQTAYSAHASVIIAADVRNTGTETISVRVSARILDGQGRVVNMQEAVWTDDAGVAQNVFSFAPGTTTSVGLAWNTSSHLPGSYTIAVELIEDQASGSVLLAERSTGFNVTPTQALEQLRAHVSPRYTNLGATDEMAFSAEIINRSNVAIEFDVAYEWRSPSGLVLRSGSRRVSLLPEEIIHSTTLETFPFTFAQSGEHPLQVQVVDGPTPDTVIGDQVSVAPGVRIEPSQTISPTTVVPDGDKNIRIDIKLKGVQTP